MTDEARRGALRAALHGASTRLPGPHRRPAQESGINEARALLENPDERAAVVEILEDFLGSGDAEQARLAASLVYEVEYGTEVLIDGWSHGGLPDRERDMLAHRIGARISEGRCPYHPALRGSTPVNAFLGAYILYDHAWFLDNLAYLFTDDPEVGARRFWYGMVQLRPDEVDAVMTELDARRDVLSDAHLAGFAQHVTAAKKADRFMNQPKGVRW